MNIDRFNSAILPIINNESMQTTKSCMQHGKISVYGHSLAVAHYSVAFAEKLRIRCDFVSLARGAALHDFFLYDWHKTNNVGDGLHGFAHPKTALRNASAQFELNVCEADIISKHMWPLTITKLPHKRESWIVCLIDKYCSLLETLKINRYGNESFTPESCAADDTAVFREALA